MRAFAGNAKVKFGDVNLQDEGNNALYGDPHSPGAGGWPTIRYYNKATGPRGQSYVKKSDLSVCDELGPNHEYMVDYVEEAAQTTLCSEAEPQNCDEKSLAFLQKMQQEPTSWNAQLTRLEGLLEGGKVKSELKDWIVRRKRIIQSLIKSASPDSTGNDVDDAASRDETKSEL